MARKNQSLDLLIRHEKGKKGEIKVIGCGDGLEMWVSLTRAGATQKKWVVRYYDLFLKRQKVRLGSYKEMSLVTAQAAAEFLKTKTKEGMDIKEVLPLLQAIFIRGVDPVTAIKETSLNPPRRFSEVAQEWLDKKWPEWDEAHAKRQKERLVGNIFPAFGDVDINKVTMKQIDDALKMIIKRGAVETAQRVCSIITNIFEYSDMMGYLDEPIIINRLQRYRKEMPKPISKRHLYKEMSESEIGLLMSRLDESKGRWTMQTSAALRLAPYVMLRPLEICEAEWSEINIEEAEWRIPAERMKMSREHIVPLSQQAIEILLEIRPYTGANKYVFPSPRNHKSPITTGALLNAIRRIGYASTKEEGNSFCTHGFRGMASTSLNQHPIFRDLKEDWIEFQLAHVQKDRIRAAYNILNPRSYLEERREMIQRYADYLDALREDYKYQAVAS